MSDSASSPIFDAFCVPGSVLARALLLSIEEAVFIVGADARIREVNGPACRMFGVAQFPPPAGVLVGQTLLEATHVRALAELCRSVQADGLQREQEVQLVGGRAQRAVLARATALSERTAVLMVLADQTELARLRTVRTEFVANVSHELRTPLASIRAMAETLLDGAMQDPAVGSRFLETIIREADRLVRLSEDLLDLTRAESRDRERTRFELAHLLSDVGARLASHAERRSIRLTLPGPGAAIWIDADQSEIDQVFFNLLDNAIKYTPAGGQVRVRITGGPVRSLVRVAVEDTGMGILSQDLPRIFERFWRADRARRFQSGLGEPAGTAGTGLGLSIVKHIVEAHGGTVTAESELRQGSRFTVTLPLSQGTKDGISGTD
jgi:two-component system phosphate regulon sensor histidine kinase PhoR